MARQPRQVEVQPPPSGELELPPLEGFKAPTPGAGEKAPVGRVAGLDYEKWACAIVDLNDAPDRVSAQRQRLQGKGYQIVGGSPLVHGWENPEVWVIPRPLYLKNREARRDRIQRLVDTRELTEFALRRETVERSR